LREEFLDAEASHELDPLHLVIDVSGLGITGYDAADWLREHQRIDIGLSDHARIEATLSPADDDQTAARLVSALVSLSEAAGLAGRRRRTRTARSASLALAVWPRPGMLMPVL